MQERSTPSRRVRKPGSLALSDGDPRQPVGRVEVARLNWRPYGRREPILRDLSLTIAPGERVLLVGPSGSGKSTLLRALAGLLETAESGELSGSVTIDGVAPGARPGAVGLVLQEPGAGIVAATVGRDVAFGLENVGMPSEDMPARVTSALVAVGLSDELGGCARADSGIVADGSTEAEGVDPGTSATGLGRPTTALSGGQTQRLALAGALALEPSVLLLDEPTAMLDAHNAATVRAAVDSVVRSRAMTLVVVEHVLGPWVPLVDRLIVLDSDGRITADGPVDEVLAGQRETLLAMGIWVPGEGAPVPVAVPTGLLGPVSPGLGATSPLTSLPLTVTRGTSTVDGLREQQVAARLDASLAPHPGDLIALTGRSGSGKSTILHALAGFLEPSAGEVHTSGGAHPADLDPPSLARLLAWIPQWASSTVVTTRVLDEALATTRNIGDARSHAQTRELETHAQGLLDLLGLGHLAEADPRHLSGGEMRRLAVASAILHGPHVVLADEPTIGQDRHTWAAVVGLLSAYRASGGAIVAATHDRFVIERAGVVHDLEVPPAPPMATADRPPRRGSGSAPRHTGRAGLPWLAGRSPLTLLLGAAMAVPVGVMSPGWRVSLGLLGIQVVLAVAGMASRRAGVLRPIRAAGRRLIPGAFAALMVGWSTWLLGGHDLDLAATGVTRVLLLVLPSVVLLPFIDTSRLAGDLGERLRFPARPVVAVAAAMQRTQEFGLIWEEIARARRVRGLGASWRRPLGLAREVAALTVGLLVRSLRAAAELAVAMDARGFAKAAHRTWAQPSRWGGRDTVLAMLAAAPLAVVVVVRCSGLI